MSDGRLSFDLEVGRHVVVAERNRVGQAGGFNARQLPGAPQELVEERAATRFVVSLLRDIHRGVQDVRRIESEIDRGGVHGTANEQSGSNEQDQRDRDLSHDERAPDPLTAAPIGRSASALAKDRVQFRLRGSKRGQDADRHACEHRNGRNVAEHAPVEREVEPERQIARQLDPAEEDDGPAPENGARDPAEQGQQQAFGQQLLDQAPSCGAQCGSHRQLALTNGGPHHEQVDDVDARNQQHEPDEHEEDPRHRRHRVRVVGFGPRLAFRNQPGAHGLVGVGVLGFELPGLHVDRRLPLRAAHAGARRPITCSECWSRLATMSRYWSVGSIDRGRYASNSTSAYTP